MKEIISFRKEKFGLFLEFATEQDSVGVSPKSGDILIDSTDENEVMSGVLSAKSFRGFNFDFLSGQGVILRLDFGDSDSIPLGEFQPEKFADVLSWCTEATGLIEAARQSVPDPDASEIQRLYATNYFAEKTKRWFSKYTEFGPCRINDDENYHQVWLPEKRRNWSDSNLESIYGIGDSYAKLLAQVQIQTVSELAGLRPGRLFNSLKLVDAARIPEFALLVVWSVQARVLHSSLEALRTPNMVCDTACK